MDSNYQQQNQQLQEPQASIATPNSLTQTPQPSPHRQISNAQNSIVTMDSNYQHQSPQQPQQQQAYIVAPIPQTPPHYHFNATEHSFIDLLMNERQKAIRNHKSYHSWDGYADEFQFEFHWRPHPTLIEAWNTEWEVDMGFWWGLHPHGQLDIRNSRRRHRELRG
ncbi:hypothetical protein DL98DRAFT_521391 [Cadophora sp. DSE1049]|nr:hypothetical protein DL98DRAFT_521391 [Cadophora sp. DSE1049]